MSPLSHKSLSRRAGGACSEHPQGKNACLASWKHPYPRRHIQPKFRIPIVAKPTIGQVRLESETRWMTKGSSNLTGGADLATTFAFVVPIPGARADRGAECDARVVAGVRVKAAGLCCLNFGPASVRAGRGCRGSDCGIVLGSNCAIGPYYR